MTRTATIIVNRREGFARVVDAVDRFADEHHIAADIVNDVQLALDEVLKNIVDYGYADDVDHEIRVGLSMTDGALEATVEDDGVPFNPLEAVAPDTRTTLQERRVGGVGLHFVKNLMDEVTYDRVGARNRLVLKKKLIT